MKLRFETSDQNIQHLPSWDEALSRFKLLQKLRPELTNQRIKILAILWLSFRHTRAKEIAEFPLFIRPQISLEKDYDLLKQLQLEIKQSKERAWLIEGDAGMGKTTLCFYLCNVFWEDFLAGRQNRIPLYIYLLDDIRQSNKTYLEAVVSWQKNRVLQDFLPANITLDETDCAWLIQQPILAILDGVDELAQKQNFYQGNRWGDSSFQYNVKVVYACRSEALEMENRIELFGAPVEQGHTPTYRGYLLENLNENQINDYIKAYVKPERKLAQRDAEWYRDWIQKLPGLEEVIQVPLLLRIVLDVLPNIVYSMQNNPSAALAQHFTRWRIYEVFIGQWIQRQAERIRRDGHTQPGGMLSKLKGNLEGYLFSYISNLASILWSQNLGRINNRSLSSNDTLKPELMEPRYRGSIQGAAEMETVAEADYLQLLKFYQENDQEIVFSNPEIIKIIRSGSLLKVDEQSYRFIHKTIIEYLTMGGMTYNLRGQFSQFLQNLDSISENQKKQFDMSLYPIRSEPNMIANFVDQFKGDNIFRELLYEILLLSKTVAGLAYAASNAITILNAMGENFSHKDFAGAQIAFSDLRNSLCESTNFRGANLEGVWFYGAWLPNAIFTGANLKDLELGQPIYLEHNSAVQVVEYYESNNAGSNDNQFWLVGCNDGFIYQWSNKTLTMIRKYNIGHHYIGDNNAIRRICVHNESNLLLAKSEQNDITLWSLQSGKKLNTVKDTSDEFEIKMNYNGQLIVSGSKQGIRVWSVATGHYLRTLQKTDHAHSYYTFCLNTTNDLLASQCNNYSVGLWSVETGNFLRALTGGCKANVSSLKFAPNGEILAAGYEDGQISLWFLNRDDKVITLPGNPQPFDHLSFSLDSNFLTVLQSGHLRKPPNAYFKRWDIYTQLEITQDVISPGAIAVIENSSGTLFASRDECSIYKNIHIESLESNILKRTQLISIKKHSMGSKDKVSDIVFDSSRTYFASWDQNHRIHLFSVANGEVIQTFKGHTTDVRGIAFSPNSNWLASWSKDGRLLLCSLTSLKSSKNIFTLEHGFLIETFAFSNNSLQFVTCGKDNVAKVWTVTGECLSTIACDYDNKNKETRIPCYAKFYSNDSLLAIHANNKLSLFSIEKNKYVWDFPFNISDYVLSSGHNLLAISCVGGNVQVWSMSDGEYRKIIDLSGYKYPHQLRFLDDNKIFAFFDYPYLVCVTIETSLITKLKLSGKRRHALTDDLSIGADFTNVEGHLATQTDIWSIKARTCIKSFKIRHSNLENYNPPTSTMLIANSPMFTSQNTHDYELLFEGKMLLAFDPYSFGLFELKTGRFILGLDLGVRISKIQWIETQPRVIITLGYNADNVNGYLSIRHTDAIICYSYNNFEDVKWNLLWARGVLPANFSNIEIMQSVNLTSANLHVLKKRQAIGIPAISGVGYTALNSLIVPLPNTSRVGIRPSLIRVDGLNLTISPNLWVVSVAKKKGASKHTFLVLEGVVNFRQFIIKAHLVTEKNTAIITIETVDGINYTLDQFVESSKDYEAQQWQVTNKVGLDFITNIHADQCTTISYKLLGDQNQKRDNLGNEYHNCVSWCKKQLRLINIDLPNQWYNFLVVLPKDVIHQTSKAASLDKAAIPSQFSSNNNFFSIAESAPSRPNPDDNSLSIESFFDLGSDTNSTDDASFK